MKKKGKKWKKNEAGYLTLYEWLNVLRWLRTVRISSEVASVFQTAQYIENFGSNQLLIQN